MKTEIRTEESKGFKPFTIEITCENVQEARMMFHLANHSRSARVVYDDYKGVNRYSNDFKYGFKHGFQSEIRKQIESQGFKL